jgi:hypothetical protein
MQNQNWFPVHFSENAPMQTQGDGCLRSLHLGVNDPQRQRVFVGNFNSVAIAEGQVNGPGEGITFDLTSCVSGFSQMSVGLARKDSQDESIDFGVRLDGDELFLNEIRMQENGKQTYSIPCDDFESVTIQIDRTGTYVEYLLDSKLVYTSKNAVWLPLSCKVVNVLGRNIHPKWWNRPGRDDPDCYAMRLPVKNLRWNGVISKVLTLHVVGSGNDGHVTTSCTSLAGNELAKVETGVGRSVAEVKEKLVQLFGSDFEQVQFLSHDGQMLIMSDVWPLPEAAGQQ